MPVSSSFWLFCEQDAQGNVLPQLHGEMQLLVSDGQLFLSACHRGDPELNYVVLSAGKAKLHHKGRGKIRHRPICRRQRVERA